MGSGKAKCNKALLIAVLALEAVLFFCFSHGDIFITTTHGMNFWECLFSGQIRNYYSFNEQAELVAGVYQGVYGAGYDFPIYIVFAIWDLPLWLCRRFLDIQPLNTFLGCVWAKSIILPFLALSSVLFLKIAALQLDDVYANRRGLWLFVTSAPCMAYLCVIGQYDIISIGFILAGVYFLAQGKFRLFLLCFSIAIPLKLFALLPFIVILVYWEKDLLKDLGYLICAMLPTVFFRLLVPLPGTNVSAYSSFLFDNTVALTHTEAVPIFILGMALLCLWSFGKKRADSGPQRCRDIVFLAFASFAIFFCTCFTLPYWWLLMTPFMYLIIAGAPKRFSLNLFLETVVSAFSVIGQCLYFYWCFSGSIVSNMLPGQILPSGSGTATPLTLLAQFLGEGSLAPVMRSCSAAAVAAIAMFALINVPFRETPVTTCENNVWTNRLLYFARIMVGFGICAVPILCYVL